jgi:hypothetical protein
MNELHNGWVPFPLVLNELFNGEQQMNIDLWHRKMDHIKFQASHEISKEGSYEQMLYVPKLW